MPSMRWNSIGTKVTSFYHFCLLLCLLEKQKALHVPVFSIFFCSRTSLEYLGIRSKLYLTDNHTSNTINGFRDSTPVCKMHKPSFRQKFWTTFYSNIQWKWLQWVDENHFKKLLSVFSTTCKYSNYIVYLLFYCWQITYPTFLAK